MQLHNRNADVYVPDHSDGDAALGRTTHLGIGAHQDDLEIMAAHGILECYRQPRMHFTGVTCTNGSGSARTGLYANYSDEDMQRVRRQEQRKAATVGEYSAMLQLDYASAAIKGDGWRELQADLVRILKACRPEIVYTHNPADKHATHAAVSATVIRAVRELPPSHRPTTLLGCEVWRDLDWLADDRKVALDVSARESLAVSLLGIFDSQIAGGKRYDLAAQGRRRANATYFSSHECDESTGLSFAMDLSPLVRDDTVDPVDFLLEHIDAFRHTVREQFRSQFRK